VCLPGTIDNDIAGTDFTIGFDTALNTVVEAVDKLRDTSNSHRRCSIIEVMGRNCGDLAVWTAIAVGAEVCIAKETGFDLGDILENVSKAAQSKRHAIIIVAENMVKIEELAMQVTLNTPFEARATVLGHVQRGGSPSARDRVLASEMGVKSIEALLNGDTHHCICYRQGKIVSMPIEEALGDDTQQVLDKFAVFKVLW
ncbi:MAG TPA: 6-phosphofructokinase, partial [Bacilli bacterium]|nr:6-phosphofructokinase [Bacilli bacterium]